MLKRQSGQRDFFDSYVYERLLPDKHILLDIKETIDFSFVDEAAKDLYSDTMGRPSFPPQVLFKMLFLEFFYNLSDYDMVEQVKTNILFRYFVGLAIGDDTPDDTTLVVFRKRLGEERFKVLFDSVVAKAKEKGLIKGSLKILDATHIIADIAIPSTVNLLRHGRRKIIKKIEASLDTQAKEKYFNDKKVCGKPTKETLEEEVALTRLFIDELKDKLPEDVLEDMRLLEEIIKPKGTDPNEPKDQLVSFADKDAGFGHKSIDKPFCGYKGHVSVDEGSGIVTSARTISGNRNEGNHDEVEAILNDDESKGLSHEAVAADSLYDSFDNRTNIRKRKMRAFIPSRTRTRKNRIHIENFIYDEDNDTLICPEGHSPISKTGQENGNLFIFSTRSCRSCPQISGCPRPNNDRVRVFLSNDHKLMLLDNVPARKEALLKRKMVESKFGEGKKWHNLHRARYRERWRVAIQVFMTFMVLNIKRMVKLLLPAPEYALCGKGFG
jgi:IS5 family transposase